MEINLSITIQRILLIQVESNYNFTLSSSENPQKQIINLEPSSRNNFNFQRDKKNREMAKAPQGRDNNLELQFSISKCRGA